MTKKKQRLKKGNLCKVIGTPVFVSLYKDVIDDVLMKIPVGLLEVGEEGRIGIYILESTAGTKLKF